MDTELSNSDDYGSDFNKCSFKNYSHTFLVMANKI